MVTGAGDLFTYPPADRQYALPDGQAPKFWVTIDTEEDFDWGAPFSRTDHRLTSLPALGECQAFFETRGVRPAYLVDWPVVSDPRIGDILGDAWSARRCEIGAQLHPWVNPPFDEEVNRATSYTGNLPVDLQRAKMTALRDAISDRFGTAPRIYRAGRYGLGPDTAQLLAELGFVCDTSVRSGFDYRADQGPDYRGAPLRPWCVTTRAGTIVELPVTTVFSGLLGRRGEALYHPVARGSAQGTAVLARLGLVERIALTPEGIPADRACQAIDVALAQRLPLLTFSFHSPSLRPGNTPYVRTEADVRAFYGWWDRVLDHLARRGVEPTTGEDFLTQLSAWRQRG